MNDITVALDRRTFMNLNQFPSLDDLLALDALARLGTMHKAGKELALTHGAISRRIARLSDTLGVPITQADGRGVRLTESGHKLAQATRKSLSILETTVKQLAEEGSYQSIIVSCERSIAARWLIPRLSDFQKKFPEDSIHLSVGGGSLNFEREGIDLALRRIDFPLNPAWQTMPLVAEAMGPVMAPTMVANFKEENYLALGSKSRQEGWEKWLQANPEQPKPYDIQFFDHHFLVAEAAIGGLGIGLVPQLVAIDAVTNKQLLAPCGFQPDGSSYKLISQAKTKEAKHLKNFKEWLYEMINR